MHTRRSFLQASLVAYYGEENYRRLQGLKRLYDPQNLIRHAQSVRLPV